MDVEALANPDEVNGWMVLATTGHAEVCSDTDILQAYQDQNTTVEPGFSLDQESRGYRSRVAREA